MQVALTRLAASSRLRQGRVFTADELAQYTSTNPAGGGKIYIAILGEVFDVSAKPEFYGRWCCVGVGRKQLGESS